jgi:hypothetical protein
MKKALISVLFFLLTLPKTIGQVVPQSGTASFSLPIFNWQDNKSRLKTFVALAYNSGNGIKVNELASSVGQGWSLLQGGVVTRIQVGLPDDQKAYSSTSPESIKDLKKYPNGRLWAGASQNLGYHPQVARYPLFSAQNEKYNNFNAISEDKQLDYFSFQFNGKSGVFLIDPANGQAFTLEESRLKISFQHDLTLVNQGVRTTITSFTIQDEDGLIYRFSNKSLTKQLKVKYTDKNGVSQRDQPKFANGKVYFQGMFDVGPSASPWNNAEMANPYVVSSWQLSEVEDPLTHRKIIYNYSLQNLNVVAGYQVSNYNSDKDYVVVTQNRSITQNQIISTVQFPDGHSIAFNYGDSRIDVPGDNMLSSIDINYSGRYLSKYVLRQMYMAMNRYASQRYLLSNTAAGGAARRMARLCLRSVTKYGPDLKEDESPHQFDYYLGTSGDNIVPAPFSLCADNWGFYNGNNSKDFSNNSVPFSNKPLDYLYNQYRGLTFQRSGVSGSVLTPKNGYAKNGLLRQVIYPTGGTLTYEYEQNKANLNGEREIGGVHVSKISTTDGGGSNDCSNPIVTTYNYSLENSTNSSMWGVEMPVHTTSSSANYKPELKKYVWRLNGPLFGECEFVYRFPGLLNIDQGLSTSFLSKVLNFLSYGSGIYSIISDVSLVLKAIGGASIGSSLIIDVILNVVLLGFSCLVNPNRNFTTTVNTNNDLNQASPLPMMYRRVEIVQGSGTMGKTVQEFSDNSISGAYYNPAANTIFTQKQRFSPWAFGLPTRTLVYDANNKLVSETINQYNIRSIYFGPAVHAGLPSGPASANIKVLWTRSQRVDRWTQEGLANDLQLYSNSSTSDVEYEKYYYYKGKSLLTSTEQRTYRPDGVNYIAETTTYGYSSLDDLITVTNKLSDGNSIRKSIRYNTDFNSGVLQTMKDNNILSIPVAVKTSRYISSTYQYEELEETANEFTTTVDGDIKPWRILKQRLSQPLAFITEYQGPGSSISQYKIASEYFYDGYANLSGVKDEGGRTVTNIYDYNQKFVVASVINAQPNLDNPAYTSFETDDFGGWVLTGAATYTTSIVPKTGSRLFTISSSNANSLTSQNLNTAKSYTVSFWSNRPSVVVSGGSLVKSGPTINGLTYYEHLVPAGNSFVTVSKPSGGVPAIIDELRLYPTTARMRTVAYDPLIGKQTECDENNRSSYYEYDNLARLITIRDESRNIVKAYDYNTINPQYLSGCPKIYYNREITEGIVRSNCGPGYLPTEVQFVIPANKYSSTISQEDADLKAEAELVRDGQSYANANGTCQLIYYNTAQSATFTTQNCNPGYVGGQVTYTVPANRYSSLVSQVDANDQALEEIEANGQAYANGTGAVCVYSTTPLWEWLEVNIDSTYCQSVNGQLPPNLFVLETDINPNSPTFNQKRWSNVGPNDACPSNTYYSVGRSQTFTRNNCSAGFTGGTWTYTVRPGKYSSTSSQAAADQLAIDEVNANGQTAANQNAPCIAMHNLTSNSTRSFQYSIRFTNNSTGVQYNFTAMANNANYALGTVPAGTYTVYICPINNYSPNNNYQIGSTYVTGVVCTWFYNVNVNGSLTVRIY